MPVARRGYLHCRRGCITAVVTASMCIVCSLVCLRTALSLKTRQDIYLYTSCVDVIGGALPLSRATVWKFLSTFILALKRCFPARLLLFCLPPLFFFLLVVVFCARARWFFNIRFRKTSCDHPSSSLYICWRSSCRILEWMIGISIYVGKA